MAARGGANGTVQSKRVVAAVLAFLLGAFGAHKFFLGDNTQGFIRLGITIVLGVFTLGLAVAAMLVIGMVEAVIYWTKSDADFMRIYQEGHRAWF
jgi:TM2 domain-containing membrane protein YozV